ncbi:MAG TPA: hypothetical protein VHR66_09960 [Gemmataceae bacterium]|jgi:hypothetical protein|nr:hypothetical protein [Gemmataceae bacterium]
MIRFASLVVAALSLVLLAYEPAPAQPKSDAGKLKLGFPYTGEITGDKAKVPGTNIMRYKAMIPISLNAGQEIAATVTVPGKERLVGMHLLDPMKKPISKYDPAEKSAKLPGTEVSAKGVYTIVVYSDALGPFTLTANSRNAAEEEEKALVEKAKQLRKELDEVEAKLKAIREKK